MIKKLFKNELPLNLRFRRFEFKYHVPIFLVNKIIFDLLNYMDWDPYCQSRKDHAYPVASLYFDTNNFACYQEKMNGLKNRKKLRLRCYERKLFPDTNVFMEIKRKSDMVIFKDRLLTSYADCMDFNKLNKSGPCTTWVQGKQEKEILKEFLWIKNHNCLLSKLMVAYTRQALAGKLDPRFRITFDYNIRAHPAKSLFFSKNSVEIFPQMAIMELKYNNSIPYWFHQIVQKYQLERDAFSKYCYSLEMCKKYLGYV